MQSIMNNKALVLILACTGLFSATSSANSANIDITGTVVASPCVVNAGNESLAIDLGTAIQADSLKNNNSTSPWVEKTLALTSCPASTTSFSVVFTGTADDDTDFYKNTGTATNLKIELTDENGNTAYKNGAALTNVAIPNTHAYDLKLRARVMSKGNVMPGTIEGQVQATFTYQ
ncbi:fimbrial protein [Klebsiella huaxiensis]|uniref:Fimbrial protein n=1 Tax=Klebsiella huaxiensis TaxID=2153354 RepID=A0ABT6E6T9_9ENTR|nr:fimbrial protein [Klebsiella huaxiensis]MDG1641113.1 fimbrial protein [Klebsiella huaxiensis]